MINCTVEANDGIDITTAAASTTVVNSASTINKVDIGPETKDTGSTLIANVTAIDDDGTHSEALRLSYAWLSGQR